MAGETDQRALCPNTGQPCADIIKLKTDWDNMKEWKHETDIEIRDLKEGYSKIIEFQGGTKVYVGEIKDQLSNMENRLFNFMGDLVKNLTQKESNEDDKSRQERNITTKAWLDFSKFILAGTIFIIVAYFFIKRG